jgi:hypothetical protein
MINRLTYVSLITISSVLVGRFVQKVVYPWAKEAWEYRKEYELYRRQQLEQLRSQIDTLLSLMHDMGEDIRHVHLELKQQLNEYMITLERYRMCLNHTDQDYAWIQALSTQFSDKILSYSHDEQYQKEIVEYEMKSLKGLLINRFYYSQDERI